MARINSRLGPAFLLALIAAAPVGSALSQTPTISTPHAVVSSDGQSTTSAADADTQARRRNAARAARRRQRALAAQQQASQSQATPTTPLISAGQRKRDQQILAAQQAQSAQTAKENAAVTGKVIRDQQAQQAEPRIQDAPGPGSQPLPGDPAVQPTQTPDPTAIQEAPGPAQTLPKPPPPQ